jgi:hypothetical protein
MATDQNSTSNHLEPRNSHTITNGTGTGGITSSGEIVGIVGGPLWVVTAGVAAYVFREPIANAANNVISVAAERLSGLRHKDAGEATQTAEAIALEEGREGHISRPTTPPRAFTRGNR